MESEPWEALDVDDSELSSFLRPCKRIHTQSHSISPPPPNSQSQTLNPPDSAPSPPFIPGPAGAIQAAMMHRRARTSTDHVSLSTQDFIRHVVQNGHESDHDFTTNPWLSALHFVRSHAMLDADSLTSSTPLNSIHNHLNLARVPQVLAVLKSCTPNGFGDMMVTLKDPTGTIGASVHHKVVVHGEFGKAINVGSVVVLQKVAVFSPNRSSCYLNITLRNIVKIFSKDCGPPSKQVSPALSMSQTTTDIESHEKSRMLDNTRSLSQKRTEEIMTSCKLDSRFIAAERHEKSRMRGNTFSLPQERTEGIMTNCRVDSRFLTNERHEKSWMPDNSFSLPRERTKGIIMTDLRLDSRLMEVADIDKQKGQKSVGTGFFSDNGSNRNQKTVLDRENIPLRLDNARPVEVTCGGELEIEMNDQPNTHTLGEGDGDNIACSVQGNITSTNSVNISAIADHEAEVKNQTEKQREISNPVGSIPRWTDEQLDELLAFD